MGKNDYWIKKAVEKPGSYRESVKRRYGNKAFTERGTIKLKYINMDAKKPGKLGKRARLAKTFRRL